MSVWFNHECVRKRKLGLSCNILATRYIYDPHLGDLKSADSELLNLCGNEMLCHLTGSYLIVTVTFSLFEKSLRTRLENSLHAKSAVPFKLDGTVPLCSVEVCVNWVSEPGEEAQSSDERQSS